jgi:amino acid transporter
VFALISLVTLIACIGIGESAWFVAIITIVELTGLGLIIFWGFQDLSSKLPELLAYSRPQNLEDYQLVWAGSFIAFYAFIGFEDIVNLAEETKNPEKNLPLAIFSALFACSFLYVLISFIALSSLSLDQLKNSQAPLADLYKQQGGNPQILTIIGLFAIINGLIAQVIMASRILYGTRHDLTVFKNFSKVDSRTSTPVFSTLFISCVILFFVFLLPLSQLASLTSFVILLVFSLVNFSLFVLSLRSESFKLFDLFFSGLALVANSLFLILKLSEHIF